MRVQPVHCKIRSRGKKLLVGCVSYLDKSASVHTLWKGRENLVRRRQKTGVSNENIPMLAKVYVKT